jgi:hypothetical protein
MGRRVRRRFRGGRVIDLGGGHGLLAQIMVLLDDSSPTALVGDKILPASGHASPFCRAVTISLPAMRADCPAGLTARSPSTSCARGG